MKQAIVSSMVKMRWENDINRRYYVAIVELDLLGDWMITRIWGRKDTSRGQMIRQPCDNFENGKCQILLIHQTRRSAVIICLVKMKTLRTYDIFLSCNLSTT